MLYVLHCVFIAMPKFLNNVPRTKDILKLICLDKLPFELKYFQDKSSFQWRNNVVW